MRSASYPTELGEGWISWDATGIVRIGLPGEHPAEAGVSGPTAPSEVAALCEALESYFAGAGDLPDAPDLVERAGSTPFTRAVYRIVSAIEAGGTMTYMEVAAVAGRPGAARAVGAAMAANPYPPVIPCHRVVGSNGSLRGYVGGVALKRRLLALEGAR